MESIGGGGIGSRHGGVEGFAFGGEEGGSFFVHCFEFFVFLEFLVGGGGWWGCGGGGLGWGGVGGGGGGYLFFFVVSFLIDAWVCIGMMGDGMGVRVRDDSEIVVPRNYGLGYYKSD